MQGCFDRRASAFIGGYFFGSFLSDFFANF